jgi:sugar/nucleoside kinase (ribokinase family)
MSPPSTPLTAMADVVCIGVHVLDVLGGPVDDMPTSGRAKLVDEICITVAGTAGGVAVDLARHGVATATIGVVGDDVAGRLLKQMMSEFGIDVDGLRTDDSVQTSMSMHAIGLDGERRPIHVVGANRLMTVDDLEGVAAHHARAVHLGGLDVLPGLWAAAPKVLADWRASGALTTLDLLGRRPADTDVDWTAVLSNVDWFLPNDDQLYQLSGTRAPADAIAWAIDHGARRVVMTLGGDGAALATPESIVHVPARAVEVRDTTGCGDAVVAGLLVSLLAGLDDSTAVDLAVVAGSTNAVALGSDAGVAGLDALRDAAARLPVRPPSIVLG